MISNENQILLDAMLDLKLKMYINSGSGRLSLGAGRSSF